MSNHCTTPSQFPCPSPDPSSDPSPDPSPDPSDIFEHPDFDGHEEVHTFTDADSGMRSIIAIHSTKLGPALGGTRYLPYPDFAAALTDALRLARGMTAKAALAGLPLGGGKAVIMADPSMDLPARARVLQAYARRINHLDGRFVTGEDVGISEADADLIHHGTRFIAGVSRREGGMGDPSPHTAEGLLHAMRAACGHMWGDRDLTGRRVVVAGLGKVGAALCHLLVKDGAEVLITDISEEAIDRTRSLAAVPLTVMDPATAHAADADIYAPCALGGVLNAVTVMEIGAAVVVGSANNQLARPACADTLAARGVLYVPDYVANAGGLIQVAGEWLGMDRAEVDRRVAAIEHTTDQILQHALATGVTPARAADQLVVQRLARAGGSSAR